MASLAAARPTGRWVDGAPVYEFVRSAAAPPVSVLRFPAGELPEVHRRLDHAHVHDFLVLAYFERGAGSLRLGAREWPLSSGDAFVIAPGEMVRFSGHGPGTGSGSGSGSAPAPVGQPKAGACSSRPS